jgi:excisionase family DNA binding protein
MSFQTIPEFLETYRLSRATLYRLVARNEVQLIKLGRSTRIDRAAAEAWAASLPTVGGAGGAR